MSDYRVSQLNRIIDAAFKNRSDIVLSMSASGICSHPIDVTIQEAARIVKAITSKEKPIRFGELPDDEKAKMFLAWCNGADIEYLDTGKVWKEERPEWYPENAYRIKES